MHVDNRRKINATLNLIKEIGGEVNAENQLRGSGNDTIIWLLRQGVAPGWLSQTGTRVDSDQHQPRAWHTRTPCILVSWTKSSSPHASSACWLPWCNFWSLKRSLWTRRSRNCPLHWRAKSLKNWCQRSMRRSWMVPSSFWRWSMQFAAFSAWHSPWWSTSWCLGARTAPLREPWQQVPSWQVPSLPCCAVSLGWWLPPTPTHVPPWPVQRRATLRASTPPSGVEVSWATPCALWVCLSFGCCWPSTAPSTLRQTTGRFSSTARQATAWAAALWPCSAVWAAASTPRPRMWVRTSAARLWLAWMRMIPTTLPPSRTTWATMWVNWHALSCIGHQLILIFLVEQALIASSKKKKQAADVGNNGKQVLSFFFWAAVCSWGLLSNDFWWFLSCFVWGLCRTLSRCKLRWHRRDGSWSFRILRWEHLRCFGHRGCCRRGI